MTVEIASRPPLPDAWRWAKLGEVCEINPRKPTDMPYAADALVSFVPMANAKENAGGIFPEQRPLSQVAKGYTYFEEGDVLFAKITPCMQNGKHNIARGLLNGFGFGTTEFHVIRPGDETLAEWVHTVIRQPRVLRDAEANFEGTAGQQRVPKQFLENLLLPIPPLEEQRRIVARLDERMAVAERARLAADRIAEAANSLKISLLREILPLGQNLPKDWRIVPLGEVCHIVIGKTPPRDDPGAWGGIHPWVKIADMTSDPITVTSETLSDEGYELCKGRLLAKGSLLYSFKLTIGRTAFAGMDLITNEAIAGLLPKHDAISMSYLRRALETVDTTEYIGTAAKGKTLNKRTLSVLPIPLPPLGEQRRIVARLDARTAVAERIVRAARGEAEAAGALGGALLRGAFGAG